VVSSGPCLVAAEGRRRSRSSAAAPGWGSIPRGEGILEHPPDAVAPLTR